MDNKFGIIDLGSNTFHILIVNRLEDGSFQEIHKERAFVGLAEEGIERISDNAFIKGIKTLEYFKEILVKNDIKHFKVFGTAALRSASNSQKFIDQVYQNAEITIEVIDGEREAELIFKGVSLIADMNQGNHVIMDIGGGSVEFILVQNGLLSWARSYNIGVGVLYNRFHHSDPISQEEIIKLESSMTETLAELKKIIGNIPIKYMVGASGSFEVVQSLNGLSIPSNLVTNIELNDLESVSRMLIKSTRNERENMNGLPKSRVKLIVVAMLLIEKAVEIIAPDSLIISPYALKEGVLSELNPR